MTSRCFMFKSVDQPVGNGGGGIRNAVSSSRKIVVRRTAAIGDCVAASVVIDRLLEMGYDPVYQTHLAMHCILRRHPKLQHFEEPRFNFEVNLDGAYERHPLRRRQHFYEIFMNSANDQLGRFGISLGPALNCKPTIRMSPLEKRLAVEKFKHYPKPWVFVCPRSDAYACRQIPDGIWNDAARRINGTKFWLGRHPAPDRFIDLKCNHLDNLLVWLSAADLLVTVDTGPMHIAAAMGIPILAIGQSSSPELHLSDQCDFLTIAPKLDCLNCQQDQCPINAKLPPCQCVEPEFIAQWANAKLQQLTTENVSAIIPIYKPDVVVLNRCLECVLPQVQEVIVTAQGDSIIPPGAIKSPKIRYVQKNVNKLGYGRNCNFGSRHSTGKYLLHMNDDVFLDPGAVDHLRREMTPGVGIVAARLMYPDGTVYFCGKRRGPNQRGWGHVNHRQRHWEITEPCDQENMNTAASLVRRTAFYEAGCNDEDFYLYAEDDALCLSMRRAGWRLILQPHASGIHMEGQSTKQVNGNRMEIVNQANKIFDRKWGGYLTHNATTIPGNFDY